MAAGDITFYTNFLYGQEDGGSGASLANMPVDFDEAGTIVVAVMNDSYSPETTPATAQLHFDDISANQVSTGSTYTGFITLASLAVTNSAGVISFDAADITISKDAGDGFINGRRIVFFAEAPAGTATDSPLIAFGDLGSNRSITGGDLTFSWNGSGIFTKT